MRSSPTQNRRKGRPSKSGQYIPLPVWHIVLCMHAQYMNVINSRSKRYDQIAMHIFHVAFLANILFSAVWLVSRGKGQVNPQNAGTIGKSRKRVLAPHHFINEPTRVNQSTCKKCWNLKALGTPECATSRNFRFQVMIGKYNPQMPQPSTDRRSLISLKWEGHAPH